MLTDRYINQSGQSLTAGQAGPRDRRHEAEPRGSEHKLILLETNILERIKVRVTVEFLSGDSAKTETVPSTSKPSKLPKPSKPAKRHKEAKNK